MEWLPANKNELKIAEVKLHTYSTENSHYLKVHRFVPHPLFNTLASYSAKEIANMECHAFSFRVLSGYSYL